MKSTLLSFLLFILSFSLLAQNMGSTEQTDPETSQRTAITIGVLQGGGSLVGADLEVLLTDRLGVQVGAGFVGFGAGVNLHFKPSIRSSFFSFQYWRQGMGNNFVQDLVGPNFVYRSPKWFTAQIGMGKALSKGPGYPEGNKQPQVMLMYAIGAYFPL